MSTSSWLYLNDPSYGIQKLSQIAFSKILPVSSVLSGAGVGVGVSAAVAVTAVIARIVSMILCTIIFTSVSSDRVSVSVSVAAAAAAAAYKTDVINGMDWNGITVQLLIQ